MYPLPLITRHILRRNSHSAFKIGDNSYVNLGRNYEETCKNVLSKAFSVPVKMVGGANDGGIDLIWSKSLKPGTETQFIGQCKLKERKGITPEVCRAFDGVLSKQPAGTVGCLITNIRPSEKAKDTIDGSQFPIIYINICNRSNCGYIKEIIFNRKFKEMYSSIGSVFTRYKDYMHVVLRF